MTKIQLLGGISPSDFLRDHWQKKPLLIRKALPDFRGLLDANELIDLACQDVRAGRWWWEDPEIKECGLHPGKKRGIHNVASAATTGSGEAVKDLAVSE